MAPFDGLLHLSGATVYTSITQLLIRRNLFDKIGLFESRWGSIGDFNWDMRAGLVANTVHVPDTWGGWRIHGGQATARVDYYSIEHERRIQEMIDCAIGTMKPLSGKRLLSDCKANGQPAPYACVIFSMESETTGIRKWPDACLFSESY